MYIHILQIIRIIIIIAIFVVVTPGILTPPLKGKSKSIMVIVHSIIFMVILQFADKMTWYYLYENFQPSPEGGAEKSIFVSLNDGLGNQLFRYAVGLTMQHMLDMPLYLVNTNVNPHSSVDYRIFFKQGVSVNTEELKQRAQNAEELPEKISQADQAFVAKIPEYKLKDSKIDRHIYHNYELVKDVIPQIKTDFIDTLKERYPDFEEMILKDSNREDIAFMHVRKGDYDSLGWSSPAEYYTKALSNLDTIAEFKRVYIISNDTTYCKEQIKNNTWKSTKELIVFEEPDELKSIYLMSLCNGAILSESTFSWWGAMFGPHYSNNSVILYPKPFKLMNITFPEQLGNKWRPI